MDQLCPQTAMFLCPFQDWPHGPLTTRQQEWGNHTDPWQQNSVCVCVCGGGGGGVEHMDLWQDSWVGGGGGRTTWAPDKTVGGGGGGEARMLQLRRPYTGTYVAIQKTKTKTKKTCGCTQALFARNQKTKNSPTCIPFTYTTARLRSDVEH